MYPSAFRRTLLFLSVALVSMATKAAAERFSIPFELDRHIITVMAKINGGDEAFRFVVDTGGRTFLDRSVADRLQLKQRGPMAKMETLDLSGNRIENVFALLLFDFGMFERKRGVRFDGMIGSDLLERFHVTLDYEKKLLVLASERKGDPVDPRALRIPFTNHPVNNAPIVTCTIDGIETSAMIDTGQPYPIVLPLTYLEKIAPGDPRERIRSNGPLVRWPGTTSQANHLGRIRSCTVGELDTGPMLALFAELPAGLSMPLLGMDFLSRFEVTIHYPDDEIVLLPRTKPAFRTNELSAGFGVAWDDASGIVVQGVWEGSAADRAGLRPGDEVRRVDGTEASKDTLRVLVRLLEDESVESIGLALARGDELFEVRLRKGMLLPPLPD